MSREYKSKTEYIEAIKTVLEAKEDFKDLIYHKHPSKQGEYLFLSDILGRMFMFDITGMKNEQIYFIMAQIECGVRPECQITDRAKMLELGKLFN